MRFFLGVAILGLCLGAWPTASFAAPSGATLRTDINTARTAAKIHALKDSYTLRRAATARAEDMARFGYFGHTSLGGLTYRSWLAAGPARFSKTGENIARGQRTGELVVKAWLASGGHRRNLYDTSFTHVGTAVRKTTWNGRSVFLYVAVFGRTK